MSNFETDPIIRETVENVVLDWLNKYPPESKAGLLSIKDLSNADEIKFWVTGVWGRITHQLVSSGLPCDNSVILKLAINVFHRELQKHRWYNQIKPFLPKNLKGKPL